MRIVLLLGVLLNGASSFAAGYRLDLQINPPFPFLHRFGQIELSIYPAGIRGEALFLKGFTRNGESTLRIANPISRMYADFSFRAPSPPSPPPDRSEMYGRLS